MQSSRWSSHHLPAARKIIDSECPKPTSINDLMSNIRESSVLVGGIVKRHTEELPRPDHKTLAMFVGGKG